MKYSTRRKLAKLKWILPNALCGLLPMRNEIILESNPDMACNTYALFRYMLSQGLNQKYSLVWMVNDPSEFTDVNIENVSFVSRNPSGLIDKIRYYVRCNRARAAISCNRPFSRLKASGKQLNIYLDHGSHLKNMVTDGHRCTLDCDYVTCQSSFFVKYNVEQYTVNREQVIPTGLPRNDELFEDSTSITRLFPDAEQYRKIILWTPTFRQHDDGKRIDCDVNYSLGLPLFQNYDDVRALDQLLQSENILLVVKPHPMQDLSYMKEINAENIRIIYNRDLSEHKIQINEFMAQTDAMITDYSSIYYDYLLLDRPIAITLDDYELYADQKGFVFDNVFDIIKGTYLRNMDDIKEFIRDVSAGKDPTLEERRQVKEKINDFLDGNSSKRVYDFIMRHLI